MTERSTQVVQQVLETYNTAGTVRSTQVVQQALLTYATSGNVRSTQVALQVLRTVSSITATSRGGASMSMGIG